MTPLERFQCALSKLGADAAIISSELNIRYLCGFNYTDGYLLILPQKAYLLTDFRYIEAARKCVSNFEIIMPESDMLSELKLLLSMNEAKTVGIEDAHVSCAQYKIWSKKFEGVILATGISEILTDLRTKKSDFELEQMMKAQKITDAAFEHILDFITPERTELEVALELEFFMRHIGAEATAFETIAVSGKASSLPHGVPSSKKLSRGFLTMDFGAKYNGYCSDMTRTIVIGKATDEMKHVYNTVLSAQLAALEKIHEGANCKEIDKTARKIIDTAGFGGCFGHSLGHGVGLYIHEAPSLSPRTSDTAVLCKGNTVTVEPGIYIEGMYGCRIEDMIAIRNDGSMFNFTKSPKNLIQI